jgi:hypothetical protein
MPLYRPVQGHLETYLAREGGTDAAGVAQYVERECCRLECCIPQALD